MFWYIELWSYRDLAWSRDVEPQDRILKVLVLVLAVADTEGEGAMAPLEAHVPTLPLQKSVESNVGKTQF